VNVFWAQPVGDDWPEVRAELERVGGLSRAAAREEESFVVVVATDDLLGRRGPGPAMVATGLLSAVRTAAMEGWAKGWTANLIAYDEEHQGAATSWAERLLDDGSVTGEVIRLGSGHIGKALP
jgi:hypothetical protein